MPASERFLARDLSAPLSGVVLFVAGGKDYTVDDAVDGALFRNELEPAIRETLELAGAEELAAELDHEPEAEDLQAYSDRFRYERDLISAGETEEWITARGLTTADFTDWMATQLYRSSLSETRIPDPPEDFNQRLLAHLWMSDGMDAFDAALQRRVAAALELKEKGDIEPPAKSLDEFLTRHEIEEDSLPAWLDGIGRDRGWLDEMLQLEAAYEAVSSAALTPSARERELSAMGTSLERVAIQTLDLDSEAAAREAVLCVREDGVSLAELAQESGFRPEFSEVWLEDVEPSLAQRLFCAEEGEALEPVSVGERFRVFQIIRKFEPSLSDPAVVEKLDEVILDQTFAALCSRHIKPSDAIRVVK